MKFFGSGITADHPHEELSGVAPTPPPPLPPLSPFVVAFFLNWLIHVFYKKEVRRLYL